jgi:molybdopterin-guanine dinucleotide biosynthesis protein A
MIGVLLAGGAGRRLGGDKAWVQLGGETLAQRVLRPLRAVCDTVVVSCRMETALPPLPGVDEAWVQRGDEAGGPAAGIASALREARGRTILAVAISLPLMSEAVLRSLAGHGDGRAAVLPSLDGRIEPLAARWSHAALPILDGFRAHADLERVARCVDHAVVPFAADEPAFMRVEVPEDVLRAHAVLDARNRAAGTLAECAAPLPSSPLSP